MLYHLLYPLAKYSIIFNVFRYITFRSIGAFVTALLFTLFAGPPLIKFLQGQSAVELIDEDKPNVIKLKKEHPQWEA